MVHRPEGRNMGPEKMCRSCIHDGYCMGAYRKDHWCGNHTGYKQNMKCPKCGKETEWLRALSRVDNKTMICDECGTKEALDAAGLTEGSSVRNAILGCIGRGSTPQERARAKAQVNGNKWAMENFRDTHN